jgi:hypothetical protein
MDKCALFFRLYLYGISDGRRIDVRCLLGESLQVIGERLTEHQGVIAVSGTYFLQYF